MLKLNFCQEKYLKKTAESDLKHEGHEKEKRLEGITDTTAVGRQPSAVLRVGWQDRQSQL